MQSIRARHWPIVQTSWLHTNRAVYLGLQLARFGSAPLSLVLLTKRMANFMAYDIRNQTVDCARRVFECIEWLAQDADAHIYTLRLKIAAVRRATNNLLFAKMANLPQNL